MRRFILTLILLLLCAPGQAASLLSVQSATQTYSVIATTTADSVPTPRYAIKGTTETYYTPLEASPVSAGPRISIGGVTYGLASCTPAIGGNISLVRDASGTWVCHTFLTSGDFEVIDPAGIATCEYLIVAGGGGSGGTSRGGGGGGGGFRTNVGTTTPMLLVAGKYPAVVGAGGVGVATNNIRGTDGATSSFNLVESTGGGGGGAQIQDGRIGGCGGGAGGVSAVSAKTGGASNMGLGAGGDTEYINLGSRTGGGGGGGAGANGASVSNVSPGGKGGDGLSSLIRGEEEWFSGGGGGAGVAPGVGGKGGGSNGNVDGAVPNTGGGGGGHNTASTGVSFTAASGIVIIRYLIEE